MSMTTTEPLTTPGERRTEPEKAYDAEVLERVGWVDKIDLETLNLSHGSRCVLGQVYGGYDDGVHELAIEGQARLYGFYTWSQPGSPQEWRALQRCWRDVLTPVVEKR